MVEETPVKARHSMRVKLELWLELAAEVFALVVFLSDDLLRIRLQEKAVSSAAARFFVIAAQLPLELQMVLCNRVVGSCKEIICWNDSELAFKDLARW